MMKLISILLAIAALVTGLFAAYKWHKSSKVQIDLGYSDPSAQEAGTYRRMDMVLPRVPESPDPELRQMNEMSATWDAMNEAANLNKVAAAWTAVSVASGALSAIVSAASSS
jgi:hypothetical protein